MRKFRGSAFLIGTALSLSAACALAQDKVIGYVKTVNANASVLLNGQLVPATPGMALQVG